MPNLASIFQTVLSAVQNAPKILASAPQFIEIVQGVMPMFNGAQQDELKSALAAARKRSDEAQADFTQAGRGQ